MRSWSPLWSPLTCQTPSAAHPIIVMANHPRNSRDKHNISVHRLFSYGTGPLNSSYRNLESSGFSFDGLELATSTAAPEAVAVAVMVLPSVRLENYLWESKKDLKTVN